MVQQITGFLEPSADNPVYFFYRRTVDGSFIE
jgi:hypothetical protein